jgi:hypothetical protein
MTSITKSPGEGNGFSWEEPDTSLLEDRRGVLPSFPVDVFPPDLSEWLARASRGAGTLPDHIAVPKLGVASSLIGKARRVQASPSWVEPLTLWTCVVGESGSRKTPGSRVVTRALDRIEEENTPTYISANMNHLQRVEKAKAEMKKWRHDCEVAVKAGREAPRMPIEAVDPGDFIFPALSVSDCTVPRLARLCMVRPRGMLQVRDELAALFGSMKATGSRPFYLESWNGGRFVVERVADGKSFTVDNLLVGLTGGFQPDKLSRAFIGDEDGLHSRFLYAWPDTPDYRPLTDDIEEVDPWFQNLLTKLIRLPAEDENGKFSPRTIPLSAGARAEFENYRRFVDREKRSCEGREQQWLAKSETHLLRLSGVLAFLDWAASTGGTGLESISAGLEPVEIDARFMVDAGRLIQEYFWPHARAALRQIGLTDRHRNARRVLRWCRANGRREISLMDVRREALGGSVDLEETRALVERLTAAGWLRNEPVIQTGGRPRERWGVNPRLSGLAETAGTAEMKAQKITEAQRVTDISAVPAVSAGAEPPTPADLSAVRAVLASAKTTKRLRPT